MNALAKTSNFFPEIYESTCKSTPIFKTNRQLPSYGCSSATPPVPYIATNDETRKQVKISQPHLFPQIPVYFPRSFQLLQQWEGRVEEINSDTFVAIISDKTNVDNSDEEVEIFFSEIEREDLSFVRPGALFYWSVGYEDGRGVPRQRVSRICFRRLPGLTTRDIERAENYAKKLGDIFE